MGWQRVSPPFPFAVPSWVQWLAQDSSGIWWGYSVEPLRHDGGWYENEVGEYIELGATDAAGWETSLKKRSIGGWTAGP